MKGGDAPKMKSGLNENREPQFPKCLPCPALQEDLTVKTTLFPEPKFESWAGWNWKHRREGSTVELAFSR